MKNGGDCKEKKEENWIEPEERILIKNNKDPPENMNQINCEFVKNSQNNEEEYVRRPMNAFMVWSRSERRKLALKYPNMLNCEISKLLGAEWSKMSENDKKPYVQESKKLRTIHSQKYPEYSYRPRRKKRKSDSNNYHNNNNGLSCYTLQNNELYDSTYSHGNFNYGYYYDQFSNPYVTENTSTCQNSNFVSQYNRNDKTNYFQYQTNNYPNTYADYKVLTPFSTDQNNFQCGSYFSNIPYVQSTIPTVDNLDTTATYNYGTINTLFPEVTSQQAEILQLETTKANNTILSKTQNFITPVTETIQQNIN